eukprot:6214742-Pleurochrysis_carterae.AAC.2
MSLKIHEYSYRATGTGALPLIADYTTKTYIALNQKYKTTPDERGEILNPLKPLKNALLQMIAWIVQPGLQLPKSIIRRPLAPMFVVRDLKCEELRV